MDEMMEAEVPSVGEQLRAAREEKGLSLEDIAAQTRIPRRHLESLELGEWDKLPAPTYTIGFARSFATSVGLDRTEISNQLRGEMGGHRPVTTTEVFEPADPARTMPKWLVLGTIAALILVVAALVMVNRASLSDGEGDTPAASTDGPAAAAEPVTAPSQQPASPTVAQGPVVLTATAPSWIQVTDQGNTLFSGELAAGQRFEVPAAATAPMLKAGKPETLQVMVGTATAPAVGPPGRVASNVSLLPADLMRGGAQPASPGASPAAPAPAAQ